MLRTETDRELVVIPQLCGAVWPLELCCQNTQQSQRREEATWDENVEF